MAGHLKLKLRILEKKLLLSCIVLSTSRMRGGAVPKLLYI